MHRTFWAAGVPASFPVALAVGTLLLMVETGRTKGSRTTNRTEQDADDSSKDNEHRFYTGFEPATDAGLHL